MKEKSERKKERKISGKLDTELIHQPSLDPNSHFDFNPLSDPFVSALSVDVGQQILS